MEGPYPLPAAWQKPELCNRFWGLVTLKK